MTPEQIDLLTLQAAIKEGLIKRGINGRCAHDASADAIATLVSSPVATDAHKAAKTGDPSIVDQVSDWWRANDPAIAISDPTNPASADHKKRQQAIDKLSLDERTLLGIP